MKALPWIVGVVLLVLAVLSAGESQRNSARAARAEARGDSLHRVSESRRFALDTLKARNAEREIGDQKHADSLRRIIAKFVGLSREHKVRADTVLMPVTEFVYLTDTVLPACSICAARLDSAVLAARAEREAATLAVNALSLEKDYLAKEYAAIRRKRAWQAKLWPVALIGGAILGSYIRGQP